MNAEATKIAKETDEANIIAQQVSTELEKALPALQEAEEALNVLTKKDISELKVMLCVLASFGCGVVRQITTTSARCNSKPPHNSNESLKVLTDSLSTSDDLQAYSKPPALVEMTLSGVMTVLKRSATWEESKKQLGDANFMMKLLQYDKDNMDDALLKKIHKFSANPDFTPESVGKVSLAAKGMCMWVRAMEVYGTVAKDVGPKRARLKAAQENLARKQAALALAQEQLAVVLAKVKSLRDK